MLDLSLAAVHHLLAFGLTALLVCEFIFVTSKVKKNSNDVLFRVDLRYGLTAILLIIVGFRG